jgi:Glycine rich protein
MKTRDHLFVGFGCIAARIFCVAVFFLRLGVMSVSAQTNEYLYSDSVQTITLNPGIYDITAYGAQGGSSADGFYGGLGAEMEGQFEFKTATTLMLMVAGVGGTGSSDYLGNFGGAGGGGSFVVLVSSATPLVVAGGGGGAASTGYGDDGVTNSSGGAGVGGAGPGGSGGNGSDSYGGGGGFSSNGGPAIYPVSGSGGGTCFLEGGSGGRVSSPMGNPWGGFGGGGAANGSDGGGGGGYSGGGGSYSAGGGGGGSIIDSSALTHVIESSGVASPDGLPNGEIIITYIGAVPVQPQPTNAPPLSISLSGDTVTVYWPIAGGWNLEQNTTPAPSGWVPSGGISTTNGTNYLSITGPTGNLFYCLKQQ